MSGDGKNGDGIIDMVETEPVAGTTMVPFHDDPVSMAIVNDTLSESRAGWVAGDAAGRLRADRKGRQMTCCVCNLGCSATVALQFTTWTAAMHSPA